MLLVNLSERSICSFHYSFQYEVYYNICNVFVLDVLL